MSVIRINVVEKPVRGEAVDPSKWVFEPKLDGQRCIVIATDKEVRFLTRDGTDFKRWVEKVEMLKKFFLGTVAVLDGEFMARGEQCALVLFDILYLNDKDLRNTPLEFRRKMLEDYLTFLHKMSKINESQVMAIEQFQVSSRSQMRMLRDFLKTHGWKGFKCEGLVAKMKGSFYQPKEWLKMK